jgi:DNA polymerase-4
MKTALHLFPEALVIAGDIQNYSHYSKLITEIIRSESPLFEKASVDEFYLDVSGMDKYFGCYEWGKGLRKKLSMKSDYPSAWGFHKIKWSQK